MINTTEYNYHRWKKYKPPYDKDLGSCSRCGNSHNYELVWDAAEFGFPGGFSFKFSKVYALKCPICPNFVYVDREFVRALTEKN
jgi:hypothetical protein